MRTLTIFFILFFISCLSFGESSFFIPSTELVSQGIDYTIFHPINLTKDGSCFVGCERIPDLKTRANGFSRVLRILRFDKQKLVKVDSIQLPITQWVNAAVSDTKNEVCVIGNNGTKILRVNLDTKLVETLWEHQANKEGFKAGPFILSYNGNYYSTGWFYDAQQVWKGDYLVKLAIKEKESVKGEKQEGAEARFIKQINLDQFMNQAEGFAKAYYYISGDQVLFNVVKPKEKKTYLMLYKKGTISTVDKGFQLAIFIGCDTKAFYSVFYNEENPVIQHYLRDLKTGKVWKIGKDKDPFTYPFLSPKGDRLIVVILNSQYTTQSAYVGEEKTGYRLQKFLHNVPMGPMKLSYDGNVYCLMIPEGIRIGYFNKK